MSRYGSEHSDAAGNLRPHVFFPDRQPELFDGVLRRRTLAFVIDALVIVTLCMIGWITLLVVGILTFGLTWLLIGLVFPAVALTYSGLTLGGPHSATIGMRVMGLEMRTWYGGRAYFVLGVVHAVLFWATVTVLTPFILFVGLFNDRKRLLHDLLLGTVVINAAQQADAFSVRMESPKR